MEQKNNKRLIYILLILTAVILVSLYFASEKYLLNHLKERPQNFTVNFQWNLARWWPWAFFAVFMVYLARRFPLDRKNWLKSLFVNLSVMLVFSILQPAVYACYKLIMNPELNFTASFLFSLSISFLHLNTLTFWIITGGIYLLDYQRKYQERAVKTSRLETQLAQAQLEVLKIQLHPHFLFNTLHAISALIHEDTEAADRMITRLSDLLRLTLEKSNLQEVPLKEELEFLNLYIEIQKTRFQDRLQVNLKIENETLDASVPNLILQPLVENAIRHGVGPKSSAGRIDLISKKKDLMLIIEIIDDGVGFEENNGSGKRNGFGLSNTKKRLDQLYGKNYKFELHNGNKTGTHVTLEIPFRQYIKQT